MKNLLLTLIFASTIPFAIRYPIIGVMSYIWIDLAAPQSFGSSGDLNDLRWGLFAFAITLIGVLFFEGKKTVSGIKIPILFVVYWIVWLASTAFVLEDPNAVDKLFRFSKAVFIGLIILYLVDSRERLEYVAWTLFLAVGIHSIQGALKTILTGGGGAYIIVGPDGTHIHDRNYFGLAMLISAALGAYLAQYSILFHSKKLVKVVVYFIMTCAFVAIIGTQSRGAIVGLVAIAASAALLFKGRGKLIAVVLTFGLLAAIFAPDVWIERMLNINQVDQDSSALSRLSRWEIAWKIALSNPWLGAGPMALLKIKDEVTGLFLVTHNMYFETLSEIGFVGFGLFVVIMICGLWMSFSVSLKNRQSDQEWMVGASRAVFCSLVGLLVSGFFLDMAAHLMTYLPVFLAAALYKISKDSSNKRSNIQGKLIKPQSERKVKDAS
jgi:putative inorganic carbon (hco3(-)) transporter